METTGAQVLQYLPDTIQTFSNQSKKTVGSLIQNIKADKTQISNLVQNITSFDLSANYTPALALRYSPMNLEAVIEFFRDSSLRVGQFFSAASSISNVINSMVSIFSSEIQKIEKDIEYLETFINNYQYISGEDDLFNFNYIENFNDDLGSSVSDGVSLTFTDRNGINFSDNGNYKIDTITSKMVMAQEMSFANVVNNIKSVDYVSNYADFVTSDTGFESTINESLSDSWNVTVKSPYVLTSQLPSLSQHVSYDYSYIRGAQAEVAIDFINEVEMDFIRLTPADTNGMQILQVVLEKTDSTPSRDTGAVSGESILFPVLNSPLLVNKTVDVLFNKSKVKKVILILNQSKYTRSQNTPNIHETNSKYLYNIIEQIRERRNQTPSRIQDLVYFYFKNQTSIEDSRKNRKQYTDIHSYRYPIARPDVSTDIISKMNSFEDSSISNNIRDIIDYGNGNIISNIVQSIVQHSIDSRSNIFNNNIYRATTSDSFSNNSNSLKTDGIIPIKNDSTNYEQLFQREDPQAPGVTSFEVTKYLNTREVSNSYEYNFNIRNISFGLIKENSLGKSCFISKKIETNGSPIGIKCLASIIKERQNLNYTGYDLKEAGSLELSIGLHENMNSEDQWIPIVHTLANKIDSEVLFFNNLQDAVLRFSAIGSTVKLYKNAILENPNNWSFTEDSNKVTYTGTVDANAIYVAEYEIDPYDYSESIIDVDKVLDGRIIARSYAKNGLQGQRFLSSGPGNKIKLDYIPFIEGDLENISYNDRYGTIDVNTNTSYSPISIKFDDGSSSINLTNYLSTSFEKANFYSTNEYLYYHNGKDIIFNRLVSTPFTVNYNHIPASVRFRAILRNNIPGLTNAISLDSVIIKSKVKNLDSFSQKLLRIN
jgi:hypothetical protein